MIVVAADRRARPALRRPRQALAARSGPGRAYTRSPVGRSQAVRQRVLVPRSQVRILAPQPSIQSSRDRQPDRSRRHGRRPRNPDAVGGAEAPAPGARAAHGRLGARRRARRRAPTRSSSSPRRRRADDFEGYEVAVQEQPLGTGDAVRASRAALEGTDRERPRPLRRRRAARPPRCCATSSTRTSPSGAAATVLGDRVRRRPRTTAGSCGDADGSLERIVEARDATPAELALREANSSIYVFRSEKLWPTLDRIEAHNAQGELYLTDAIGLLVGDGETVAVHVAAGAVRGGRQHARRARRGRRGPARPDQPAPHARRRHDRRSRRRPGSSPDVEIEPDVDDPSVRRPARPHAHRDGRRDPRRTRVARRRARSDRARSVGPFCYLRPGTVLEADSKAGTFVEIKNSRIGPRTKVPHLSYIGDAEIGEDTNIGAGAITANFPHQPGRPKGRTRIGENVRTGIQNGFVAPVEVGDGAWIAAGSTITKDVPAGRARGRACAPGEQGGICRSAAERLSSCFPASTTRSSRR